MRQLLGKHLLGVILLAFSSQLMAAGAGIPLDKAPVDLHDKESLKRGAEIFATNCLSCHSADTCVTTALVLTWA